MSTRTVFIIGILLMATSGYSFFKFVRETLAASQARSRYRITVVQDSNEVTFGERRVVLKDDFFTPEHSKEERKDGTVKTIIDGEDYSLNSLVTIRPFYSDANRYHHWIRFVYLHDNYQGTEKLAIVQRIDTHFGETYDFEKRLDSSKFRILWLNGHRPVVEERFNFAERSKPLYRTLLASQVFPTVLSFYYQDTVRWPTAFYPVLYPILSALLGIVLAFYGGYRLCLFRLKKTRGEE